MTAEEIEKRLDDEFGLSEIIDIQYDSETKEFYLDIFIDFKELLYTLNEGKFYKYLDEMFGINFELFCMNGDNFGGIEFEIINRSICTKFPSNEIEEQLIDYTKKFFAKIFYEWGIF